MIARTDKSALRLGGKGLNINQNLAKLKIPSFAFVFLAGTMGKIIDDKLAAIALVEREEFWLQGESRINTKILGKQEIAINEAGPVIDEKAKEAFIKSLAKLKPEDHLIMAGSLPPKIDLAYLLMIKQNLRSRLVLDIPNLSFADLALLKPQLIKPNLEELGLIFNEKIDLKKYRIYCQKLIDIGVENVLLSLGKEGSYYTNKQGSILAKGPEVEVLSTTACGDTLLAYFLAFLSKGESEALKTAEAAGRLKAQKIGLVAPQDVLRMKEKIELFTWR